MGALENYLSPLLNTTIDSFPGLSEFKSQNLKSKLRMSEMTHSLSDLIHVLNDGIGFYDEAAKRTSNHVYTGVFARMHHLKSAIVSDLNEEIALQGERPPINGTWLGDMRINYAELLVGMSEHPDHVYISQVEAQEDRVIEAFKNANVSDKSERVRELARLYLPEVQRMHDEIKALKDLSSLESGKK